MSGECGHEGDEGLTRLAPVPESASKGPHAKEGSPAMILTTRSLVGRLLDFGSTGHAASFYDTIHASGYVGVLLDLETAGWQADAAAATAAGLGVALFQGYFAPYFQDPAQATTRGAYAVAQATSIGYPHGAVIFLDWESAAVSASVGIDWINAWAAEVVRAGFAAGLYVGVPQPLSADELYLALPNVHLYWRSLSGSTVGVATRGYAITQSGRGPLAGVAVDDDASGADHLGGHLVGATAVVVSPSPNPLQVEVTTLTAQLRTVQTESAARAAAITKALAALQTAP